MKPRQTIITIVLCILLTACTFPRPIDQTAAHPEPVQVYPSTDGVFSTQTSQPATGEPARPTIDLKHLPVGDGRVSTQPKVGYVWSCNTSFNGSGAFTTGSWMHSDGSFDLTAKPSVDGQVKWPSSFTITLSGEKRLITGNDLPNHPTGVYPISPSDDAYSYDHNPNAIKAQNVRYELPAFPAMAGAPTCLPMGQIGVLLTGSYLFNALDAGGKDAVAHEIQDDCQGHPQQNGSYHYHDLTTCIDDPGTGHSALLGYALDGFGIYGMRGENGETLTNADLDECHGHTHEIEWDGHKVMMYHYHATYEYPYTLGCFRGTPLVTENPAGQQPGGRPGTNGQHPPQEAINACVGLTENAACTINTPNGDSLNGVCRLVQQQQLACIPAGGPGAGNGP